MKKIISKIKYVIICIVIISGILAAAFFLKPINKSSETEIVYSAEPLPAEEDLSGETMPDIIETAQAWCDTYSPYVYGGNGENGPGSEVDCSAFTVAVYGELGIELPRVSYDQAEVGEKVDYTPGDYSNLLPGDLVIMNDYGHCGIYAGGGMVIHASSAGGKVIKVPMSNFSSGFVNEIRRVIPGD